ncbi:hypothetical protein LXA43DRAFT_1111191 [Ganoderma leucocontextum]|nr:hypothetical protein LXA43DRAFT_1111191 [Ganoderma leucocontextum]
MVDGIRPEPARGKDLSALQGEKSSTVGSSLSQGSTSSTVASRAVGSGAATRSGTGASRRQTATEAERQSEQSGSENEPMDRTSQRMVDQQKAAAKGKARADTEGGDEDQELGSQRGEEDVQDGEEGPGQGADPPAGRGPMELEFLLQLAKMSSIERRKMFQFMALSNPKLAEYAGLAEEAGSAEEGQNTEGEEPKAKAKQSPTVMTVDHDMDDMFTFADKNTASDPRIVGLLKAGFYWPLTGLTSAALRSLNDGSKVKMIKTHMRHTELPSGSAQHILDASVFAPERSMSVEDWREGWQNLIRLLPRVGNADVQAMFSSHHEFLTSLDYFRVDFDAILEFDIWLRHAWFTADPERKPAFHAGSTKYLGKLNEFRLSALRARIPALPSAAPSPSRYHPYPRDARGGTQRERAQPFRGGRGSAPVGPLCLICAGSGHMAKTCGRTTLSNGKPVFSAWAENKLVEVRSRRQICASWNVGGILPCKSKRCPGSDESHICSFCGSPGHTGADLRCL